MARSDDTWPKAVNMLFLFCLGEHYMKYSTQRWGWWLRFVCAVALVCTAFTHRAPVLASGSVSTMELAEYVLPDGTIPVLCLPDDDNKGKPHDGMPASGCEVCRLTTSIILPPPAHAGGWPTQFTRMMALPPLVEEAYYRQLFPPNASPRGPPGPDLIA